MKLFWALIAVLVLVGGGFLLLAGPQQRAAEKELARVRDESMPPPAAPPTPPRSQSPAAAPALDTSITAPAPSAPPTPPTTTPLPADQANPASAPATPAKVDVSMDDVLNSLPTAPVAAKPPATPSPHSGLSSTPAAPAPAKAPPDAKPDAKPDEPEFDITPASIAQQDDGTSLVDGKYTLRGDGSPENPYVVPWELLTSAEHTYNPAEGKKKISEAITMLDGKHVKLNGFIAFPLMVQQPRELLSMLNQWDGCCIGVPPTPYDAVEVRLKDKVTGQKRFMTAGSITGIFRVKPYLTGKWLVGLWIMDDGEIVNEKYGAGGT